jgi:hypothetical protein
MWLCVATPATTTGLPVGSLNLVAGGVTGACALLGAVKVDLVALVVATGRAAVLAVPLVVVLLVVDRLPGALLLVVVAAAAAAATVDFVLPALINFIKLWLSVCFLVVCAMRC